MGVCLCILLNCGAVTHLYEDVSSLCIRASALSDIEKGEAFVKTMTIRKGMKLRRVRSLLRMTPTLVGSVLISEFYEEYDLDLSYDEDIRVSRIRFAHHVPVGTPSP